MSLLDDYQRIHTTLFGDVVPRAKDTIATLEDALHKVKAGEPVDAALEAFGAVRDIVTEIETVVHSTQTPAATEPVQTQAPQLGGMSIVDVANAQPAPIAPAIPAVPIVPAPAPVPVEQTDQATGDDDPTTGTDATTPAQ